MGLDGDQVNVLKRCFDGFADEEGAIPADNVGNILSMMGLKVKPTALKEIIEEIDEDGECSSARNAPVRQEREDSGSPTWLFRPARIGAPRIWRVLPAGR